MQEEDIRSILSGTPAGIPRFDPDLDHVAGRARSRGRRRAMAAGLALVVLAAGVAVPLGLLASLGAPQDGRATPRARPVLLDRIRVQEGAVSVAVGEGAVWVAGFDHVSRLDPATGEVVATVRTPLVGDYSGVAVGEGAVWVTSSRGSLYRIDPATNEVVAELDLGESPTAVTVGGGFVWVSRAAGGPGDIVRIDPRTDRVVGSPITVGPGPGPAVYFDGSLWVLDTGLVVGEAKEGTDATSPSLSRVDPVTGEVTPVDGPAASVSAIGGGALWGVTFEELSTPTAVQGDAVVRVDPGSNRVEVVGTVDRAQEAAFGEGYVWVLTTPPSTDPELFIPDPDHPGTVVLIDPATGETVGEPLPIPGLQPISIAAGAGSAWVADFDGGTVTQVGLAP
jgi:DNA-binding beta-propeller fold protein YncE